jgi:hypothetical protein
MAAAVVSLPARFELVKELGRGGMGTVYEAIDRDTGGRVAVKALMSGDADLLALFKREYRQLHDISHPNLVALGEMFCEGGLWAYSMELVDGEDVHAYVRGNEPRLRKTIAQLAEGLGALHAAGRIHRDVKPSNILVRRDGHLFLLDFGLVLGMDADEELSRAGAAGTPAYMAPEQVLGEALGPESDMYGVGVILFEALTGQKPFSGAGMDVMTAKVENAAPRVHKIAPHAPRDLSELAARLLERDPRLRPSAADVVAALTSDVPLPPNSVAKLQSASLYPPAHPVSSTEVRRFFGREEELARLEAAYKATRDGAAACVLLEGESGVGKSLLVRRFLGRLREADLDVLVLTGRCYEKESVPYKAFDSVIDALVRRMLRMPPVEAAMLLPTHLGALVQTFPIFRRIDVVAQQTRNLVSRMDPLEMRSRAFTALREVFERLAQRSPLIVAIDDMQWSDQDSMGLLAELVREPSPPPFLLLLSARPSSEVHEAGARFREVLPPRTEMVSLSRLPHEDAVDLARWLLKRTAPGHADKAEAIAREAEGHALFIEQLTHYVASDRWVGTEKLRLEDVLEASVRDLEPAARRIFTLLCVAGAPMPLAVLSQAAALPPGELAGMVAKLRANRFIQTATTEGIACIEPYHGRVRVAALASLTTAELAAAHERLARTLEGTPHGAAHVLAELWRGAGDAERAGDHALRAAEHAVSAFAFDRAATFYRWALERPSATAADKHRIRVALGGALAMAGRGVDASEAYKAAAATASDMEEQLDLECRAADQLLRVGHFDAGIVEVRSVLQRVGLSWPRTPLTTVLTYLWLSAWRAFLGYKPSPPRARSALEAVRLHVCFAVTTGLGMCDNLRAAVFHQRFIALALKSGDPRRISTAFSLECPFRARAGEKAWASTSRIIERALAAAQATGDPYCIGFADFMVGGGQYLSGRFRLAVPNLLNGQDRLRSECPGTTWEIVTGQLWLTSSLYWSGEGRMLAERQPVYLREATDRGDVYGTVHMSIGYGNFAWLVLDDATTARERAREAMRRWSHSAYRLEQFYSAVADVNVALYSGDGPGALQRIDSDWAKLEASLLRQRVEMVRVSSSHMRARALVAAAEADGRQDDRSAHLHRAERIVQEMASGSSKVGQALATLVAAAVAEGRGDRSAACAGLRTSVEALEKADMGLFAAAARRYLGKLVGGDEGAQLVNSGETAMRAQAVRNVAAMSRCLVPGFARGE